MSDWRREKTFYVVIAQNRWVGCADRKKDAHDIAREQAVTSPGIRYYVTEAQEYYMRLSLRPEENADGKES